MVEFAGPVLMVGENLLYGLETRVRLRFWFSVLDMIRVIQNYGSTKLIMY
jgi:hypothetical protein